MDGSFVSALAAAFAPTGIVIAAGPDAQRGEAGAHAWLSRDTLNARSTQRWVTIGCDVSVDGRDGYSYGLLDLIRPTGDTLLGYYSAYWRRSADGRWQLLAFGRAPRQRALAASSISMPMSSGGGVHRVFPMTDTIASLAMLFAAEHAFNDSAGVDVGRAFATFAAPTAVKPNGTAYALGPSAIHQLFSDSPRRIGPTWAPQFGTVATSNDLGFTTGRAAPRDAPAGPGGRYFTIWQRQQNGTWRYIYD